jgi:uncharacterized membrane protein
MSRGRLEAFSDGVLAIVITIMVLELRPPEGVHVEDLFALWPKFLSYVMSFAYIGIYWVNHHHLLQTVHAVNGRILWANLFLLFWLSLIPFSTAWMGENSFAPLPTAVYGLSLIMPSIAFAVLVYAIVHTPGSAALAAELGRDWKGKFSTAVYAVGIPIAFVAPVVAVAMFVGIAALWIVPDRRFERCAAVEAGHHEGGARH